MKSAWRYAIAAVALSAATACSTTPNPSVTSQAAPGAPLSTYRSYAWAGAVTAQGTANPLVYQSTHDALDASLRAAGFTPSTVGQADMIVGFTLGARDKVDVTDWGPVGPYYPGYGRGYRYGWAYSYNDIDVRNVTEGSMALDVYDGKTNRPVWHGIAKERLGSQGASDQLISAAARNLVDEFVEAQGGGN